MPDALIWPAVALILGLVALLLFRTAINRKIAGITRAGKDGVLFERQQEGREPQPLLLSFVEVMRLPISASALSREQSIEQQVQHFTDSEKITALTRELATTRIALEFNSIANVIFGSQVTLLVQLSSTHNGVARQQAIEIFEQAQTTFPELHGGKKFDDWLAYLQSNNLITAAESKIDITQFGTDFLKYLVDARMAYNRYG
jgi:hypothetical protein